MKSIKIWLQDFTSFDLSQLKQNVLEQIFPLRRGTKGDGRNRESLPDSISINTKQLGISIITKFCALALVFNACSNSSNESSNTPSARAPVTITHIKRGAISDSVTLSATTFYLSNNKITAPISGYITKAAFQIGDRVRKGQLMFTLQTQEANALQGSQDSLAGYGNTEVRAPVDGSLESMPHVEGDFVQQGATLAKLVSPGNLFVKLFVPYKYLSDVNKNSKFAIQLPAGKTVAATFSRTLNETDSSSQSIIWLLKPNERTMLPQGLNLSVNVATIRRQNSQILPKDAVLSNETLDSFWVMKVQHDTLAVRVPVKKGIETAQQVEIKSPEFSPSDKIIISGQYGLEDSSAVQITGSGS